MGKLREVSELELVDDCVPVGQGFYRFLEETF
jgi:hypothetical protein